MAGTLELASRPFVRIQLSGNRLLGQGEISRHFRGPKMGTARWSQGSPKSVDTCSSRGPFDKLHGSLKTQAMCLVRKSLIEPPGCKRGEMTFHSACCKKAVLRVWRV